MRQAISDAADALPPPGPLLLAGMIDRVDPHPTRAVPDAAPRRCSTRTAIEVVRDAPVATPVEAIVHSRTRTAEPTAAQERREPQRAAAGAVSDASFRWSSRSW